jgi:uncharacterized membrane protein
MSDEAGTDHPLERLVFFSDAVFAIAITLLVIEIEIPDLPKGASVAEFRHELASLIPSFAGYLMSFAVIAAFWAAHHSAFSLVRRYSRRILPWNLGLLGMIALTPWVTGFLSRNLNALVPTAVYFGAFTITALLNARTVFVATEAAALEPEMKAEVALIRRRCLGLAAGAATAFVLAFILPEPERFMGLLAVPLWTRVLTRGSRPSIFARRQEAVASPDADGN